MCAATASDGRWYCVCGVRAVIIGSEFGMQGLTVLGKTTEEVR